MNDVFPNLDKSWEEANPLATPLLSECKKTNQDTEQFQSQKQSDENEKSVSDANYNYFGHWFAAINLPTLPFHHLISAAQLTSASAINSLGANKSISTISHAERLQFFWHSLAANGISAKEAALFDDSLEGYFVQKVDNQLIEVDWEVLYFDELQGCAEIYRTEMLVCKRRIYEAGEDLRVVLELSDKDLNPYLNQEIFTLLTNSTAEKLFFDSMMSSFNLTISGSTSGSRDSKNGNDKKLKKFGKAVSGANPHNINAYRGLSSKRIESWMGREGNESDESNKHTFKNSIYRIRLSDYWMDWQRAARIAKFDFNYLQNLTDVRAIRFYELTKLWRVSEAADKADKKSNKLEIDYDKFALLMPIPKLSSEQEIVRQIRQLIKPLKADGYVKSFRVRKDWRGINSRNIQLIFKFNDF